MGSLPYVLPVFYGFYLSNMCRYDFLDFMSPARIQIHVYVLVTIDVTSHDEIIGSRLKPISRKLVGWKQFDALEEATSHNGILYVSLENMFCNQL